MSAKPQARRRQNTTETKPKPRALGFILGLICGIALTLLVSSLNLLTAVSNKAQSLSTGLLPQSDPSPTYEFYTTLPNQRVGDLSVPTMPSSRPSTTIDTDYFIVQAGSFKNSADAEKRRAELILLGLDPTIDQVSNQAGDWHRVYLGPLTQRAEVDRVKALTASQNIDTLILSRRAGERLN